MSPFAGFIYRQQRRGALVWGSVFGIFIWVSAYGFETTYPKMSDRLTFAESLGTNAGISALFGPAHHIETTRGFTAWRCASLFSVIGAVWGLLLATKVLRGDEEEGRADLLYAGPVTRASGIGALVQGLAVVWLVLFATVATCIVTVGVVGGYFSWTASLFFSVVVGRVGRAVHRDRRAGIAVDIDAPSGVGHCWGHARSRARRARDRRIGRGRALADVGVAG